MFNVYADFGKGFVSIYNPFDEDLTIHNPKVTLEVGKSGSFQFELPPTNDYYDDLKQLKTRIVVEYSDGIQTSELFRGRVFTVSMNFNKMKTVYCEGLLAYLVDSVQKAKSYKGNAQQFFRNIIATHNSMVEEEKQFVVGDIDFLEGQTVIIPGKKDDDDKYYGTNKYEQAIIESMVDEWVTTFDYISNVLTDYLGGYLVARYNPTTEKNVISYVSDSAMYDDTMIIGGLKKQIEFGENLIDLNEELNADDLCTIVIPLGDTVKEKVTTIEKATNKKSYENKSNSKNNYYTVKVGGKEIGIANEWAVNKYGRIVKTHAFENVNDPNTLMKDGVEWLKKNKNIPIRYTIKAVDMRFIDPFLGNDIELGEVVGVYSSPHDIDIDLVCTKIEYDLSNPGNNSYTLGSPDTSLTERYRKNKNKDNKNRNKNGSKTGAGAAAAAYDAEIFADDAVNWYQNHGHGAILAYKWVSDHSAGALDSISWYNNHAAGAISTYKWITEYGSDVTQAMWWYGHHAGGLIKDHQWLNTYSGGIEHSLYWYNTYARGLIEDHAWLTSHYADVEESLSWYGLYAGGLIKDHAWLTDHYAGMEKSLNWYSQYAAGLIKDYWWIENYSAGMEKSLAWYNDNAAGVIRDHEWVGENGAKIEKSVEWYNKNAAGIMWDHTWIGEHYASTEKVLSWHDDNAYGIAQDRWWISKYYTKMERAARWYDDSHDSLASITQLTNKQRAAITSIAKWTGEKDDGTGFYTAFSKIQQSATKSSSILSFLVGGTTYDEKGKIASITLSSKVDGTKISLNADTIKSVCSKFLVSGDLEVGKTTFTDTLSTDGDIVCGGKITAKTLLISGKENSASESVKITSKRLTVNSELLVAAGNLKIGSSQKSKNLKDYIKSVIDADYIASAISDKAVGVLKGDDIKIKSGNKYYSIKSHLHTVVRADTSIQIPLAAHTHSGPYMGVYSKKLDSITLKMPTGKSGGMKFD